MLLISLCTYLCLVICAQGSRFIARQSSNSTLSIDVYIQQVKTVVYAIDQIKLNASETACNDNTTEARLNSTGLDGTLGQLLLCEDSIGVVIFPNITQAERETKTALSALQAAKNVTDINTNCKSLRLDALGQAGIDTDAITALLCDVDKATIPAPSSRPLWGNTTKPYGDTASSPTGIGIRVNISRLAIEPIPSASYFITTMANGAALTLPMSIPLNGSFSTILSQSLVATRSTSSWNKTQQFSANIPLNGTFSTILAVTVTSTTSITTTLPPGTTQAQPATLTSTASASVRDPRTVTIWEIVYVTAIHPSSTRIPLTAAFSTQLVPTVTVTSTTSIITTGTPQSGPLTLTSTALASVRDPRTVTIWQIVYVTAIKPSTSSNNSSTSLRIPLTASFSTQLVPVVTVTSTTSVLTTGGSSPQPPVTLTSTASMPRDPRTVTIWQVVYVTAIQRQSSSAS